MLSDNNQIAVMSQSLIMSLFTKPPWLHVNTTIYVATCH